ncbi:MAG: hypothetical protein N3E42_01165 [Candidatus Bipolaricaulota bacterium]|nr:hypothetical protein [Candidatus Bipolaricaulota bacterium]
MRTAIVIVLLSLLALGCCSFIGEARLISLGGGALVDVTGVLGSSVPITPIVRLSIGILFVGADLDLWFLSSSTQLVPSGAIRLSVLSLLELYGAIAPMSFQISPTVQTVPRATMRWGANLILGLISIFGELVTFAQWSWPVIWQGPGVGLGVQVGF